MNGVQDSRRGNVAPDHAPRRGRLAGWVRGALATVVVAFIGWRLAPHVGAMLGIPGTPGPVPQFAVTGLDGLPYSTAGLRGRVVLVNGWATWCPPCIAEMPLLERMAKRHRARGLVVLGLSADTLAPGQVADWLAGRGISFPVAIGTRADFDAFAFDGMLPTSWLLDRQGRIRHRVVGPIGALSLELAVRRLLDE